MKIDYDNPILICVDKIFNGVTDDGIEFDIQAYYTEEDRWQVEKIVVHTLHRRIYAQAETL